MTTANTANATASANTTTAPAAPEAGFFDKYGSAMRTATYLFLGACIGARVQSMVSSKNADQAGSEVGSGT